MVMESPSPECVGREFVRQYYTLMNEAPDFLHRFYSSSSSFVHSGVDRAGHEEEVVHGQKEIHKKIKELNFKDCHTKIRQVDSQATIGDGVVVQVTGELSNQSGPMRRFMQTFVLAHQPPKQYYVNNDIFRYQDEVFPDSESEEEKESRNPDLVQESEVSEVPVEQTAVQSDIERPAASTSPVFISAPVVPAEQPPASSPPTVNPPSTDKLDTPAAPETEQPAKVVVDKVEEKAAVEQEVPPPVSGSSERAPPSDKPSQFSWANVAAGGPTAVAVVPPMNTTKQNALPLATIAAQQKEDEENAVSAPFPEEPVAQPPVTRNVEANARPPRHEERGDRRTNERFPDTNQIFVGNLPLDIADLQLKRFFNGYGKVLDVRVNRSGHAGKVPFGFVVFESEEPVTQLLQLKRVEMDGHRLNVEEKKARNDRAGSNSRAGRGQRSGQRGGSRPKDRENSNTRSEGRNAQQARKFGR